MFLPSIPFLACISLSLFNNLCYGTFVRGLFKILVNFMTWLLSGDPLGYVLGILGS